MTVRQKCVPYSFRSYWTSSCCSPWLYICSFCLCISIRNSLKASAMSWPSLPIPEQLWDRCQVHGRRPWTWSLNVCGTVSWKCKQLYIYVRLFIVTLMYTWPFFSPKLTLFFLKMVFYLFIFIFFWLHSVACKILVPQPGIKPMPPAVEAPSLNKWTAREVPKIDS